MSVLEHTTPSLPTLGSASAQCGSNRRRQPLAEQHPLLRPSSLWRRSAPLASHVLLPLAAPMEQAANHAVRMKALAPAASV